MYVPFTVVVNAVSPEMHAVEFPRAPGLSSRHSNVAPCGAVEANENTAEPAGVCPLGPAVIDVSGAIVSTVKDSVAGGATAPAMSVARTQNVYRPSASGP